MIPKFRAWLPRQKEMVEVKELTFVDGKVRCVFYRTGTEHHDSDILSSACYEGVTFNLMQSTGLEDFDGKEIFEGDVLATANLEKSGKFTHIKKIIVDGTSSVLDIVDYKCILGNIYENPDLVKEVQGE